MKRRHRSWLVLATALVIGAVCLWAVSFRTSSRGYDSWGSPPNSKLSRLVPDDRPRMKLDLSQSWRLKLGRGSGMDGLDTVSIDRDGRLELYRQRWETTSAQLTQENVADIVEAIEANDLLGLAKAYHAGVYDGTQWVLWIRQGEQEKTVYFDNHFPDAIVRFANQLDEIITRTVGPDLRWRWTSKDHQRELWESIRR